MTVGPGIFYDGVTSARHDVTVDADPAALIVRAADGAELARWPYDKLDQLAAPDGLLRIGLHRSPVLARLEVHDAALAAAIDVLSLPVDQTGSGERRGRRRVAFWTVAAAISLAIVGVYGIPAVADRLAPLIPYSVDRKLGDAVDAEIRAALDPEKKGAALVCGADAAQKEGRDAFVRLVQKLEAAAGLPIPLNVVVLRNKQANAITLPGGRIYVFEGLIDKAENANELAGVLAHELGHVAHRDGTKSVLQGAGLSFMFGMLLGDFLGGGAVVFATRTMLTLSYSREVEARADAFGVNLMNRVGGDAHALGTILNRIAGAIHPGMKILLDHPETVDRIKAINASAAPAGASHLLEPPEWAALKRICAGG